MNFGTLLKSTSKSCIELVLEGYDKVSTVKIKNIAKYLDSVSPLRHQFVVYDVLYRSEISDKDIAMKFIDETILYLDEYSVSELNVANSLFETIFEIDHKKSTKLDKAIGNCIDSKLSGKPNTKSAEHFETILDHVMTTNKTNPKLSKSQTEMYEGLMIFTPKHVVRRAINNFNTKYEKEFSKLDKRLFELLKSEDQNRFDIVYESTLTGIDSLSSLLDEDDLREKINTAIKKVRSEKTIDNLILSTTLLESLTDNEIDSIIDPWEMFNFDREPTGRAIVDSINRLKKGYPDKKSQIKKLEIATKRWLKAGKAYGQAPFDSKGQTFKKLRTATDGMQKLVKVVWSIVGR